MKTNFTLLVLTLALLFPPFASGADAPAASPPDYNAHIAPLFKKYCVGCHDAESAEGQFALDTYPALLKGGEHGAAVVAGDSKRSRLVRLIAGEADPKMPPKDADAPSMKPEEIALIRAWVDAGAKGPSGAAPDPNILVTPNIPTRKPAKRSVHAVEYSPDGKLAAIASYRTVRLVNPVDGTIVRTLSGLAGDVTSVRFSKDGTLLITASGEPGLFGEATLWKVVDGTRVKQIRGHKDSLYAAELSPDGLTLATAGYDKDIKLWDVSTEKERKSLKGHNDAVYGLAFSPNGKWLASASGDRTAKLWDVATGERLETFPQALKELYTVTFTPNGKHLLAGGVDNRIRVWQLSDTGKEGTNPILYSRYAHEGPILRLVFTKDGKHLASTSEDRYVKLWSTDMYVERLALEKQPDWAAALAFAPEGNAVLVGRHDGTLALYDPANGNKQRDLVPMPAKPELTALEPRGLQVGATHRVKLIGKNLVGVSELKSPEMKLVAKIVPSDKPGEFWAEITPAAGLARGTYEVSAVTPGGATAAVKVYIDDLPQVAEQEPNETPAQATLAKLPASFWGMLNRQGDEDYFAFEATKGQTIVLDVAASQLGSKVNALLTITDDQGRVLASSNDFDGQSDPLVAYTIPADGRYSVRVRDLLLAGSAEHFYRLSVGAFPYITAAFPLSLSPNQELDVELAGYNLPAGAKARVKAGASGSVTVPLDTAQYRFRKSPMLVVGNFAEQLEIEPNDTPMQATRLNIPGTVGGRTKLAPLADGVAPSQDVDLYRFHAKAGQTWILETDAAGRGSPIDTKIDVLDAKGAPVERLLLQATRDSYITFRGIDSRTIDARVKNWEEMELNQYLYIQGEICRIFRMPQGPDSGFNFYSIAGKRYCYFDTSPTTHALDEPCYIVEPHAPGTKLVPNGLPVFPLFYSNDDSGDRKLGSDSRLTFTAPADGDYLVRVTDTRNRSGDRFVYRLTVRPPKPDFSVSVGGAGTTVGAASGQKITFTADRIDGFDGDIRVEITGLPPGFHVATPVVIQSGHFSAQSVLYVDANAPAPTAENAGKTEVKATAVIDGQPITRAVANLGQLKLGPKPKFIVRLEPAEITIVPGETVAAMLKVERNGFTDRINFDVENLPHGVIVDNIGLSGVLIREGESERQIFLAARKWVPETERTCQAVARVEGNQSSPPILLKVKNKTLTKGN